MPQTHYGLQPQSASSEIECQDVEFGRVHDRRGTTYYFRGLVVSESEWHDLRKLPHDLRQPCLNARRAADSLAEHAS